MPEPSARFSAAGPVIAAALCLGLALIAWQRNLIWLDDCALWRDIRAKSPGKARAHYNLGVLYQEAGDLDAAYRSYRSAIMLDPRYVHAYTNLGKVSLLLGRHSEAVSFLQAAIFYDPRHLPAHFNLGVLYVETGRPDMAKQEFKTILEIRPDFVQARTFLELLDRQERDDK